VHHGAGSDGNRQILRKQVAVDPTTGRRYRVPFISGNSLKHMIRAGAARFALHAMGVEPGTLGKGEIHLLFSGGALSGGGATVPLKQIRELERLFPAISMCGYSAGNNMTSSKLSCDHTHLVCAENAWRVPESLRGHAHTELRVGELIHDDFGTRHEPTRADATARRLLKGEDAERDLDLLAAAASKSKKAKKANDTAQMLYTFETVIPGAVWYGGLYYDDITGHELAALKSGLAMATRGSDPDGKLRLHMGAKSSIGFGRISAQFSGSIRKLDVVSYEPSTLPVPTQASREGEDVMSYVAHLKDNKGAILKVLKDISS